MPCDSNYSDITFYVKIKDLENFIFLFFSFNEAFHKTLTSRVLAWSLMLRLITVSITCRLMEFWISRFVEASSASHYHPVITPFLLHKLQSDKNKLSHIEKIKLFLETRSHGEKYHARLWSRKIVHVPQIFCLQVIITVITFHKVNFGAFIFWNKIAW